jgi:hypothetical protein
MKKLYVSPAGTYYSPQIHSFLSLNTFSFSKICEEDPNSSSVKYAFSPNTSNTSLRMHLDRYHRNAYIAFCEANNYPNQLASHKALLAKDNLADQSDMGPRPKYSPAQLLKSIVNFVIADDQVSAGSFWSFCFC